MNKISYATLAVLAMVFSMGPLAADMWGSSSNANQNNQNQQEKIEQAKEKLQQAKTQVEQTKQKLDQKTTQPSDENGTSTQQSNTEENWKHY